ncbi:MAG: DEAD/DEAH box helicase [Chloroflexi bacterium]|nr:DEAD/DEAH box helicase [Chloroflexota bacterium]
MAVVSRDRFVSEVKDAYIALLTAAISNEPTKEEEVAGDLRRYALWLEDAVFGGDLESEDANRSAEVAASLYEFVARLTPESDSVNIFQPPLNDFLRSTVLGSITQYRAQASTIGRRVGHALRGQARETESAASRLHLETAATVVSLLGRDYLDSFSRGLLLRRLASEAVGELRERDAANWELLAADRALAIGLSSATFACGMLVGAGTLISSGKRAISAAKEAAFESDEADYYWLADRLGAVFEKMEANSMHRVLSELGVPVGFRRAMARTGALELWGPQLEAVDKCVFSNGAGGPNLVVSVPTGAGKTLIAELAILSALQGEESAWAVYVAPSRALVNQVSTDLRRRLREVGVTVRTVIAGAEQGLMLGEELDLLSTAKSVTVLTPEKLDAYYRNARELFDSCRLVVFDEAQKLSEPNRGPLMESLISRFLVLQAETRLVLLSGAMSNHDEIASWLGPGTESVVSRRRPNRQMRGLAVRHDLSPRAPRQTQHGVFRRVDFTGGLVFVHEEDDLDDPLEMQVGDLFRGHFTEERQSRGWRERTMRSGSRTRLPRSTRNQHALGIAQALCRTPGTVLVFTQTTTEAESTCRGLQLSLTQEGQAERERLAAFLAGELGEDHELVEFCKEGKAYHHARLPTAVQRGLALGLEQGWIKAMFATGTLKEGLNTPATYVIVVGDSIYDPDEVRLIPMAETDFENLAGRAGRPYRETEGLVVLVPNNLSTARTSGSKYLLSGDEALRARSQLDRLASMLEDSPEDIGTLPPDDQSIILGLKAAGLTSEESLGRFFEQTLWAVQEEDFERPSRVSAGACSALGKTEERIGEERLEVASRTGLSLSSVEQLFARLEEHSALFSASRLEPTGWGDLVPVLMEAVEGMHEVRQGLLRRDVPWGSHVAPLEEWVNGSPYDVVLEAAISSGALAENATIGHAVKYSADMSTWLSWAFGASCLVLESMVGELATPAVALPLTVKYGVPSATAAYVSMLGVSDRYSAQVLAQRFGETNRAVSPTEISNWLSDLSERDDELEALFESGSLRLELLRRQAYRQSRRRRRIGDRHVGRSARLCAPMRPDKVGRDRAEPKPDLRIGYVLTATVDLDPQLLQKILGQVRIASDPRRQVAKQARSVVLERGCESSVAGNGRFHCKRCTHRQARKNHRWLPGRLARRRCRCPTCYHRKRAAAACPTRKSCEHVSDCCRPRDGAVGGVPDTSGGFSAVR